VFFCIIGRGVSV